MQKVQVEKVSAIENEIFSAYSLDDGFSFLIIMMITFIHAWHAPPKTTFIVKVIVFFFPFQAFYFLLEKK